MYAIIRAQKIKSQTDVSQACAHNLRLAKVHNADAEASHKNRVLFDFFDVASDKANTLNAKLQSFYESKNIKQKSGNVQMLEFVLTASPEFFENSTREQRNLWYRANLDFLKSKFADSLKLVVLHLDEKTPHLHAMISTDVESVKTYKNRFGSCEKKTWSLNAKRFDRAFLTSLQTEYAQANSAFGLKRGVSGRKAKHKTLKQFYRDTAQIMKPLAPAPALAQTFFQKLFKVVPTSLVEQFQRRAARFQRVAQKALALEKSVKDLTQRAETAEKDLNRLLLDTRPIEMKKLREENKQLQEQLSKLQPNTPTQSPNTPQAPSKDATKRHGDRGQSPR